MSLTVPNQLSYDADVRRAVREDVPAMARVFMRSQQQVGSAADRDGITQDAVMRWMLKALLQDDIWILEREPAEVVGVVAVIGQELDVLDVDPNLTRRGYGTLLIETAKWQRPGGLIARVGTRRVLAKSFLVHHGFRSVSAPVNGVETLAWGAALASAERANGGPSHL